MDSDRGSNPSKMRNLALVTMLLALAGSTARAHTPIPTTVPTNTDGPSPTPTASAFRTPTGTFVVPALLADAQPNPARVGQRVTLDATRNPSGLTFHWQQVPGDVQLDIVDADQPVAHFIAPAVAEITVVQVQLQSPNDGRVAYVSIQLLP